MLRVHPSTVYGLCERGELAHARVSNAFRIAVEDVRAFVRSRRTDAPFRSSGLSSWLQRPSARPFKFL